MPLQAGHDPKQTSTTDNRGHQANTHRDGQPTSVLPPYDGNDVAARASTGHRERSGHRVGAKNPSSYGLKLSLSGSATLKTPLQPHSRTLHE